MDESRLRARVEEISSAAEAAGVELGGFALDDPRVTYDVRGSDVALLQAAVAAHVREPARA
jgi:hypothetical protein